MMFSEPFILCFFLITVGIPMASVGWIAVNREKMKLKKQELELLTGEKAAHTAQLEERVRVLERLATDRGLTLADEIEQLRDERVIPVVLTADLQEQR